MRLRATRLAANHANYSRKGCQAWRLDQVRGQRIDRTPIHNSNGGVDRLLTPSDGLVTMDSEYCYSSL